MMRMSHLYTRKYALFGHFLSSICCLFIVTLPTNSFIKFPQYLQNNCDVKLDVIFHRSACQMHTWWFWMCDCDVSDAIVCVNMYNHSVLIHNNTMVIHSLPGLCISFLSV